MLAVTSTITGQNTAMVINLGVTWHNSKLPSVQLTVYRQDTHYTPTMKIKLVKFGQNWKYPKSIHTNINFKYLKMPFSVKVNCGLYILQAVRSGGVIRQHFEILDENISRMYKVQENQ